MIQRVAQLLEGIVGADIAEHLENRLAAHVQAEMERLGMDNEEHYLQALNHPQKKHFLVDRLLAQVLVHETFFYRYAPQLRALEQSLVPALLKKRTAALSLWSAGCSRGPEPYTLAMIGLAAMDALQSGHRLDVLATDVCQEFLEAASVGTYGRSKVKDLPSNLCDRYLVENKDETFTVKREVKKVVRFLRHNLVEPAPPGYYDIISCRNVLMYFRPQARAHALEHLAAVLADDGYLLVGHSESLRDVPELFTPAKGIALGVYAKAGSGSQPPSLEQTRLSLAALAQKEGRNERDPSDKPLTGPKNRPLGTAEKAAPSLYRITLDGDYDESTPHKLAELKSSLSHAMEGQGAQVSISADGASCLDSAPARLIKRAERIIRSHGGSLAVEARRAAVRRWAERYELPMRSHDTDDDGASE